MDKETKTLFITIALALGILWFLKPKGTNTLGMKETEDVEEKYSEPKVATESVKKQQEDAVVALQAMRDAINNREPKRELDKLNSMIFQDYGVKVLLNKKTLKLRAMSKSGKVLAEEN
jgi:hypothetical protein